MEQKTKPLSSVLIKPAGPDCNMACTYCFYLEKKRLFPEKRVHRMRKEVLEETIRQVMRQGERNLSIAWQGGEPTLLGLDFFKTAVEFQRRFGRVGQVAGNGFQTNGLLIDGEWCRFLQDGLFLVGLSLDGPQHVHDRYRIDRGGKPTWQRVMDARKRMLDSGVEVNALTVVNDYSARFPREIYQFHRENGLNFMQFIPCLELDPGDPSRATPFSVGPEEFGTFLCEVFDCWLEDFEEGRPTTFIRWFDSLFFTYVGFPPPECTLLKECGIYVVVEHNGDVFACDFFVEHSWKLGNVMEGRIIDMLNSEKQVRFGGVKSHLPQECHACQWLPHCRGSCTRERLNNPHGSGAVYFCRAYKKFFEHADAPFKKLAERWQEEQRSVEAARTAQESSPALRTQKIGRNDPCPCGSGKKFKRCCGK